MARPKNYIELQIGEDLKQVIGKEVEKLEKKSRTADGLEPADLIKLEKLTKSYSTMMNEYRENVKSGLFKLLGGEELKNLGK